MKTAMHRIILSATLGLACLAAGATFAADTRDGLAPAAMRAELTHSILSRWAPEGARRAGVPAPEWARLMKQTLEQADMAQLERAASAASLDQANAALLGAKALGDDGVDLVFTPVLPCRLVDTRVVGGPIASAGTRDFIAYTGTNFEGQGGASGDCGLPENAAALLVKVTAVNPVNLGFLTAYPTGDSRPLSASLTYTQSSPVTSNESLFKLCRPACPSQFTIYANAQTNVVVDVEGYFMEPEATAIECVVAQQTGNLDLLGGLQPRSVNCPAGYAATGGGCGGPLGIGVSNSQPVLAAGQPVGWRCDLVGSLLSVISYQVSATCCRVPGR